MTGQTGDEEVEDTVGFFVVGCAYLGSVRARQIAMATGQWNMYNDSNSKPALGDITLLLCIT